MKRGRSVVAWTAAACVIICAVAIWARWEPDGVPVCAAIEDQWKMVIIPDGAGGTFIAWEDLRAGKDVYAQHVDAQGNMMWPVDGLAICDTINDQVNPRITSDGFGGVIVSWSDRRSGGVDIYAQRVDAAGNLMWEKNGKLVISYTWDEGIGSIVADGVGGAIVVWQDLRGSGSQRNDIYVQRIDSDGDRQWDTDGVALCTQPFNQMNPIAISDGAEGAIVCWEDGRAQDNHLYVQRVDSLGDVLWTPDGEAIMDTTGTVTHYAMATDGAGGAILSWTDRRASTSVNLYAQRIDFDGSISWLRNGVGVCIAAGTQGNVQMIPENGGAIITWDDARDNDLDIYVRKITAAGDTLWDPNGVALCTANGVQYYPFIATDGAGGAIVTWYDRRISNWDIYAQRVDGGGNVLWIAGGAPVCTQSSQQMDPQIVADGAGGGIVAWIEYRNYNTGGRDIYVGGIDASGDIRTPTLLSSFDVKTTDGSVTINWRLSDVEDNARFHVFRCEVPGDIYARAGAPIATGDGLSYVFTDADCEPGKSYRYRVDVSDEDGYRMLFETEALLLPAAMLTLEQNKPNPFNPSTTIRFRLAQESRVNLSVFDPAGRKVATLLDEMRPAGWNEVRWNAAGRDGRRLSSGVYLYRLKAGKQVITKKMTVLK